MTAQPRMYYAYAWRDGTIEFGDEVPDGALAILHDRDKDRLTELVEVKARHGYDGSLLVAGVPEADDEFAAVDALARWRDWAFGGGCASPAAGGGHGA